MLLNEIGQGLFFGQRTGDMVWFISAWLNSLLCQNRVASSIHPSTHPFIGIHFLALAISKLCLNVVRERTSRSEPKLLQGTCL